MKLPLPKEMHDRVKAQLIVVSFAILLAALIYYFQPVWGFIEKLFSLIAPFLLGFAVAFLLNPIMRRIERLFTLFVFRRRKHPKLTRALSALLAMALLIFLVTMFCLYMMPQLVHSIKSIASYISLFLSKNSDQINQILLRFDIVSFDGSELVVMWDNIVSSQLNNITALLSNLMLISSTVVNFFITLLVGIITAFYLLIDKDHLTAMIKKIGYALFRRKRFEELIFWTRRANKIFSSFITGKIVDSAIIGVICYLCMLIFRMEYPMLISIIIGVTNLIPFFGPFIGWVPSVLILLLVNPVSALWFSVFILILQQLDGNLIGPFILGDYVGVSALSIMVAIVIGSGLFGFIGMLVSVPVFALCYSIFRAFVNTRLTQRRLSLKTEDYTDAPENLKRSEERAEQ